MSTPRRKIYTYTVRISCPHNAEPYSCKDLRRLIQKAAIRNSGLRHFWTFHVTNKVAKERQKAYQYSDLAE